MPRFTDKNPSRPRSNGREAFFGSSLRVESARIEAKPPHSRSDCRLTPPRHPVASRSGYLETVANIGSAGGTRRRRSGIRTLNHSELKLARANSIAETIRKVKHVVPSFQSFRCSLSNAQKSPQPATNVGGRHSCPLRGIFPSSVS